MDRGYLLGDSIFETIRAYNSIPFRLTEHLCRFEHSAEVLGIQLSHSRAELRRLIDEILQRSGLREAYLRVTLSRGTGGCGLSPIGCDSPVLSIIARKLSRYPDHAYRRGIITTVIRWRRVPAACLDTSIKCGNYLPNIVAKRDLDALGMIEGVQQSIDGEVVGGTASNIFVVHGHKLSTPRLASGALPGITRAAVIELASEVGLSVDEALLTPEYLNQADEMFFTNTIMECLPVAELDGHRFLPSPGPITQAIQEAFNALVRRDTDATDSTVSSFSRMASVRNQ